MTVDGVFKRDCVCCGNKGEGKAGRGSYTQPEFDFSIDGYGGGGEGGRRSERNADRHSRNAQAKSSAAPTTELNLLFDVCILLSPPICPSPPPMIVDSGCTSSIFLETCPSAAHVLSLSTASRSSYPREITAVDGGSETFYISKGDFSFLILYCRCDARKKKKRGKTLVSYLELYRYTGYSV